MDLGITGKRVLITGASQGLGRAIAVDFAREGCQVAVVARSEDKLQELVTELGGREAGHALLAADLMDEGNPTRTLEKLIEEGGAFDIVVHNVGGTLSVRDPLATMEEWNRVWRFNVGIAIEMNRLAIPPMQEKGWGRVIHISSRSAIDVRGSGPYATAKAYLNAYIESVGRSVAQSGVVVSGVAPGALIAEGGHWDNISKTNPTMRDDFLRHHQAIGRFGTPEEVSPFVLFMASELVKFAATSILPINGGAM